MESSERGIAKLDLSIGLNIVALGAVLGLGLQGIEFGTGYDRIGPRFFPYVVAVGLIVLGGWFVAAAFLRHAQPPESPAPPAAAPFNWTPIGYLVVALVLTLALLDRAGFVIACAIQFWLVARAFGSRRPVRDAIVASGLSLVCFVAFAGGLGLTLPSGILEGVL